MASITKRGSSYQVQVRRAEAQPVSKCFKSLNEAKAWARQIEAALDNGSSPIVKVRNSNVPTFAEALNRYAAEVVPAKKGAAKEAGFIRHWLRQNLAAKQLSSITPQDMANYRDQQQKLGIAPSSVVRHLCIASHLYTIAIKEWGYSLDNPVLKIRKPKVSNARSRRPSAAELDAVLSQLPTDEMRVFVRLASDTAMRRSELFSLKWQQVDVEKGYVFLPDTKNGSSRTVVIGSKAAALFKAHQGTQTAQERVFC